MKDINKPDKDFDYKLFEGIYEKPSGLKSCPFCGSTRQLTIGLKSDFLERKCEPGSTWTLPIRCHWCGLDLRLFVKRPEGLTDDEWYEYALKATTEKWNTREAADDNHE